MIGNLLGIIMIFLFDTQAHGDLQAQKSTNLADQLALF